MKNTFAFSFASNRLLINLKESPPVDVEDFLTFTLNDVVSTFGLFRIILGSLTSGSYSMRFFYNYTF